MRPVFPLLQVADGIVARLETNFDFSAESPDENILEVQAELPSWPQGRFLGVKFVDAHSGMEEYGQNIDIKFIGFVGILRNDDEKFAQPRALGAIPVELDITAKGLQIFNVLTDAMGQYFAFGTP